MACEQASHFFFGRRQYRASLSEEPVRCFIRDNLNYDIFITLGEDKCLHYQHNFTVLLAVAHAGGNEMKLIYEIYIFELRIYIQSK